MKEKIKEVEQYFKNKLLTGDFVIQETDEHVLKVIIDNEYIFNLWIGNISIPESRKCYESRYNFMHLQFHADESIILHDVLLKDIQSWRRTELLAKKRAELQKLENELS